MAVLSSPSPSDAASGGEGTPRIAFFSCEWCLGNQINLGGSDYWRLALPASKLYEAGWDVMFARNLAEGSGDSNGRICVQDTEGNWHDDRDVIVIQRWMGEGTAERILRAREAGQIIVNDVDDDYWNFPEGHVSTRSTDPEHNERSNRAHYRESIKASSLITVSTAYLAETLGDWGPPVKTIRNYVDMDFFARQPTGDYVGWVGGLPWRGKDLEILRETVVPWLRDRGLFFYHGGAVAGVNIEDSLGYDRVTTRPLAPLFGYPRLWEPLRVILIPIDDTPFGRAKSAIKGLEAASKGVPFIHSPHAEYEELGMGLCAREPGDWVRWLEKLEDPDFYAKEVERNLKRAEALDIKNHWEAWATTFSEVARGEKGDPTSSH